MARVLVRFVHRFRSASLNANRAFKLASGVENEELPAFLELESAIQIDQYIHQCDWREPDEDWEVIADNLSKVGWSWGCVSAIDATDEQLGLQTRIATMESASLCVRMKS